jgi:hypothetical protein
MSEARDAVLGRLRQSLGRSDDAAQAVAEHLAKPSIIPARGDLDLAGRIALFTAQA